jgi:hypothetical protein
MNAVNSVSLLTRQYTCKTIYTISYHRLIVAHISLTYSSNQPNISIQDCNLTYTFHITNILYDNLYEKIHKFDLSIILHKHCIRLISPETKFTRQHLV